MKKILGAMILFSLTAFAQIPAPQVNLTGNIGCQGFPCVNNGTLNLTSDADYTMTVQDTSAFYIKVTSSVSLTSTRKLIYPFGRFPVGIENATTGGQNLSVCGSSGSCVTVPNDPTSLKMMWNDGTNFVSSFGVSSFNSRTGAVVPQTGDYTAPMVTNAADVTAANTFLQRQTFNNALQINGGGANANLTGWSWDGVTDEIHQAGTFEDFVAVGTATSSQNYGSMNGPGLDTSYWTGSAADRGKANSYVTCGTGSNPLCTQHFGWTPDSNFPPVGGTATFALAMAGPLTVPDLYDTALTTVNDCVLVGAGGHFTQGSCSGGGVNATSIQGIGVSATAPTTGQSLVYNGSQYVPGSGSAGLQLSASATQTVAQSAGTVAINNLNNYFLASQYGNGTTNSIATAVALNGGTGQDTVVDPGYATTETIPGLTSTPYGGNVYSAIPNWPQFSHVQDDRVGKRFNIFTESGSAAYVTSPAKNDYYFNTYNVTGATDEFNGFTHQNVFEGQGQQINGFGGVNLKTYWFGNTYNTLSNAAGQTLGSIENFASYGVGDGIANTWNCTGSGGSSTYTDEGLHCLDATALEAHAVPIGVITGQGSGYIKATMSAGQGTEGRLRYLGDDTEMVATGLTTTGDNAFPAPLTITTGQSWQVPPMATVPGASFTPSTIIMGCTTAYGGTCPQSSGANPTGQLQSAAGGYAPGTVNVLVVTAAPGLPTAYSTTSSGFSMGDTVCVADSQYVEQAPVTAVPDSSHITITFRYPHFNGFTIAKGGYCGYGIESTGSTTSLGGATYKQVFPVVATLDATHLLVWDHDSQQTWSRALIGNNSQSQCQTDTINNFSYSSGTITVYDTGLNALFRNLSGVTVSVPGFASWTPSGTVTMTTTVNTANGPNTPALSYPITGTPTGSPTTGTITFCNSTVNLYPIAETTAVLNPSTNAADGYFGLAPYAVPFTTGDTVEQFHWPWQQVSFSGETAAQELPLPPYTAFTMGYSESVGDNFSSYSAHTVKNLSAQGKYQSYGGTLVLGAGTIAYNVQGPFGVLLSNYSNAPDFAIINNPNCKAAPIGCSNPGLSPFMIYSGVGSQEQIWDNTAFGSIDFSGGIRLDHGSFSGAIYMPSAGNFALSADQSASPTPSGNLTLNNLTVNSCTGCASPIANIQIAMPTGTISNGTCTAYTATTMTGVATTSTITFQNATDDTGVTGWAPTAPSLTIDKKPTANTVNWRVCNTTGTTITPGAITMNVSAK